MFFFSLNLPSYLAKRGHSPGVHAGWSVLIEVNEVSPYCSGFELEIRRGLRFLSLAFLTLESIFKPGITGLKAAGIVFVSESKNTPGRPIL